ncbi:MAG: YdcH family protein [Geminicoccaceae bacterium]|nr:YdcH family protein [Geminicoccaceae bacterium]
MSLQEHVVSLRSKHARLEQLIDDEQHRPLPDQTTLAKLKREKLRVKDELENLQLEVESRAGAASSATIN